MYKRDAHGGDTSGVAPEGVCGECNPLKQVPQVRPKMPVKKPIKYSNVMISLAPRTSPLRRIKVENGILIGPGQIILNRDKNFGPPFYHTTLSNNTQSFVHSTFTCHSMCIASLHSPGQTALSPIITRSSDIVLPF